MKILVVAPEYGNSPYAASLRYEALCRELIQNPSITVEVVSGCGEGSNTLSIWQRCFNINARKGSTLVRLGKELIFGVRVSVLVAVRRPDFILLSVPNFISFLLTGFFCKLVGIPYLIDTRDLYPATYVLGGLISREGYFYAALCRVTRYLYAGAFHNFSATKGLASELYDSFDLPAFPDVVMNGYPAALCDEITSKSPTLCRDVIMHGTFGRMQNVSLLLDVVMKMPDTTFTFIGEGVMFQQVREAKLDNVVVYSRLPHEEVLRIVAQHKVGLSFRSGSWYDGMSLPVKIFEFLGLGLSVVSYPRTEFDDDQYARTRITNIDSPVADDIAQALSQALSDVRGCGNFNDSQHLSREYQSKVFSDVIVDRLSSPYGKADVS